MKRRTGWKIRREKGMEEQPTYGDLQKRVKELEQQLEEKKEEYQQLKRIFLSHVNHEIRTPMNSIIGFSSLLADNDITREQKQLYLSYINNSSESLLGIIENMIDMAMLEAGQVELQESSFSVGGMLEELYARLSVMKQKRNKDLVALLLSRPQEPAELNIVADRYRLEQIMMNLAENAMKFTDRGVIEIGFRLKNENILQLFVKDTGRGIDAGHHQMIFESFRISRKENDPHIAGSGLGLSIVKSLVELMKGEVWMEPNGEQGSIFKINLPLKQDSLAAARSEKKGARRSFLDDLRLGSRHLAI
ncbi:MAG TPA: hypothetical protein ENF21_05000 [Bacteroidetes bacterium]|nr:hypothetical protein [Bacteroidota bacterium]